MNKKLLGNNVLIKVEGGEKKTQSGLILAKVDEMGDFMTGIVSAVGRGKFDEGRLVPPEVEVGDKVIFQYGKPIMVEGEQFLLVVDSDIIIVL